MRPVPESLRTWSDWAWRAVVIGIALVGAAALLARLRLVVVPAVGGIILATLLVPPARWLERRGWPSWLAAVVVFAAFIGAVVGAGVVIVPALVDQFADLGPTLADAVTDLERWATEGPLDLDDEQLERYRDGVNRALRSAVGSGGALAGAIAVGEMLAGAVLALVTAFLVVKDGRRLQEAGLSLVPRPDRARASAAGRAAWGALRGYVRAAAIIGGVEAVVIGATLAAVGAGLAVPVAIITFVGGFFPVVGAIVAGVIAVMAALATGGAADAAVVAAVALVVQQFDNDFLAPVIYGRAVRVHPLAVVLAIASAATLWGIAGAFLVVPAMAVATAVAGSLEDDRDPPEAQMQETSSDRR